MKLPVPSPAIVTLPSRGGLHQGLRIDRAAQHAAAVALGQALEDVRLIGSDDNRAARVGLEDQRCHGRAHDGSRDIGPDVVHHEDVSRRRRPAVLPG